MHFINDKMNAYYMENIYSIIHVLKKHNFYTKYNNINSSLLVKKKHPGHKTITAHKHLGIMLQLNHTKVR